MATVATSLCLALRSRLGRGSPALQADRERGALDFCAGSCFASERAGGRLAGGSGETKLAHDRYPPTGRGRGSGFGRTRCVCLAGTNVTGVVRFASGVVTLDVQPQWTASRDMVTFPIVLDALDKQSVRRHGRMRGGPRVLMGRCRRAASGCRTRRTGTMRWRTRWWAGCGEALPGSARQ